MTGNISTAQNKVNFFEGGISYLIPIGSFGQHINSNHLGLEMAYLRQVGYERPLFWGVSMYFTNIGSFNAITTEVIDFGIYDFNSTTKSNLIGLDGKFRYYPDLNLGKVEWYIEAVLGFKWLFIYTSKTFIDSHDSSSSHIDKGEIGLNYGVNTGFQYKINDNMYLNLKGGYYQGLSTPYFAYNNDRTNFYTTLDKFDLKQSTTDLIHIDLGITYRF